ncbi:MAG: cytochrome c biogenesis protein CcsA [Verrucomicrobiae bacterium]|nr:cytochrome c biogenesis protein CcsA [Verrucomicrobiae bacterium]
MDKLLLALSTLCFLGGFIYVVMALRKRQPRQTTWLNFAVVAAGFVFQCLFLHSRGQLHGRCPVTSGAEILIFLSWSIVLFYFLVGRAFRLSLLGMFTEPIVFVFQAIALAMLIVGDAGPQPVDSVDPWHEFHISVALLSFGAFALAGVAGIMYLVQDRQLKKHHLGALFYQLPPIRYLLQAIIRLLGVGLALLTVAIISALFQESEPDPKHYSLAIAVWLGYAALLGWHFSGKATPKRVAIGAVIVFVFPIALLAAL